MNTITPTPEKKLGPVRNLGCCCCGNATRGRQWWNRDTGYGICPECVEFVRKLGESEDDITRNYGVAGVHYAVDEAAVRS